MEADEACIGKKDGKAGRKHPGSGGFGDKRTILSLMDRGGKIRFFKIGGPNREFVAPTIRGNVDPASTVQTDGAKVYRG